MIGSAHLEDTRYWINQFRAMLSDNPPMRLHTREVDGDGLPQWHPEFAHWLAGTSGRSEGSEDRARLQGAMKRLRERSLREYEVLRRILIDGEPVPEVTTWLNARAIRGGHPERYTDSDTLVIVYAAVDKTRDWW